MRVPLSPLSTPSTKVLAYRNLWRVVCSPLFPSFLSLVLCLFISYFGIGDVFTVTGLQMNTSYVFAVGAGDAAGKIMGTIGLTSIELVPLCPLPMLQCWALLALSAHKLSSIFLKRGKKKRGGR